MDNNMDETLLDRFLNWLLGLDDGQVGNLPSVLEQFTSKWKKKKNELGEEGWKSFDTKPLKEELQKQIDADPQTRDIMSQYLEKLGIDNNKLTETEKLSKDFGKYFLTESRPGNIFGNVNKEITALKKAVKKYADKREKLKAKGDASMKKIVQIEQALYKADRLKEEIDKIEENTEEAKAKKKELERLRDNEIREAAKLRSINRPLSLVRDIERELRNTLSREKRAYNALTGQEIEICEEGGQLTAKSVNVVEKLGGILKKVDAIKKSDRCGEI